MRAGFKAAWNIDTLGHANRLSGNFFHIYNPHNMTKQILFTLSLLLCFPFMSKATHLMGGEITARQLTGADYEVTLTTYRDTFGIPMATSVIFELKGVAGNLIGTYTQPQDTTSGALLAGYPYGVEVYTFTDTITLPGIGTYHVSFSNCCRNGAIQNLANPLGENMYLETQLTYFGNIAANSTPVFLVEPVIFLPVRTAWQYNPLPFDSDGDSLVWSLDTSLTAFGQNVAGYTTPPDSVASPFSIDPNTGTISWIATQIGNFNASVLVEEYRNGSKIGEIRRDMQFIVVNPGANRMPQFGNFGNLPRDPNGYVSLVVNSAQGITLSLLGSDPNPQDVVNMFAYGEALLLPQNAATFETTPTGNGNEVEGVFSWWPDVTQAREKPYLTVFRVWDNEFAFDETVFLNVRNNTAVDEPAFLRINQVYPNPASHALYLSVNVEKASSLSFTVYTYAGMQVQKLGGGQYAAGQHVIRTDISDLAAGAYFLAIEQDGRMLRAQKFVVAR